MHGKNADTKFHKNLIGTEQYTVFTYIFTQTVPSSYVTIKWEALHSTKG